MSQVSATSYTSIPDMVGYRWIVPDWKNLVPLTEHVSPPFRFEGIDWCFRLYKGRKHNPDSVQVELAVHKSSLDRLVVEGMRLKLSVLIMLKDLKNIGIMYKYHSRPVTVTIDEDNPSWSVPNFIKTREVRAFVKEDEVCFMVQMCALEITYNMEARRQHRKTRRKTREADLVTVAEKAPSNGDSEPSLEPKQQDVIVQDHHNGEGCDEVPFSYLLNSERFSDVDIYIYPPTTDVASSSAASSPLVLSPRLCAIAARSPPPQARALSPGGGGGETKPHRFPAHRAFLANISPFFQALFSNGMRETFEREIALHDISPRAFKRILTYAYTRKCSFALDDAGIDEAIECLICADHLSIEPLVNACWSSIRERINHENVWEIWQLAKNFTNDTMSGICRAYCQFHMSELIGVAATLLAPPELLHEVLELDCVNLCKEEDLIPFVTRWASCRKGYLMKKRRTEKDHTPSSSTSSDESKPPKLPAMNLSSSAPSEQPTPPPAKMNALGVSLSTNGDVKRSVTRSITPMPASARDSVATLSLGNSRTIATVNLLGTTRTPLPRSMYSPPTTDDDWSKQTAKGDCSPTSASKKPTCCNRPISPSTSTSTTATTDVGDGSPTTATASPALSCVSASNDVDKAMVQLQDLVLANGAELEDRDAAQLNQLSLLLRCIRFPQMDKIYLLNHIEPLAKKFEPSVMKSLLIEAYRHHAFNNDPLLKERGLTHVVLALGDHDPLALARSQPRRPFPYRDFQQILST